MKHKKAIIAISGGVDSAVSAYLLKKEGFEVEGVYMKLHQKPSYHEENIAKIDIIAKNLGMKYEVLDIQKQFDKAVFDPFVKGYIDGFTPNPCVVCNKEIKLGALLEYAKTKGDFLATGHYAKVKDNFIYKAKDSIKDQSYFLGCIKKENISFLNFPLGDMLKEEVKQIASSIEWLEGFSKQKESTEICFVENTYLDILKDYAKIDIPGVVKNLEGKIVGKHEGYMHYTIGKRRGFSVNGAHDPHYVVKIDAKENVLYVGTRKDLDIYQFEVKNLNMFIDLNKNEMIKLKKMNQTKENENESKSECENESESECESENESKSECENEFEFKSEVKIRYRTPQAECRIKIFDNNSARVKLKRPVYALAKGQYAVFYDNDKLIGAGEII